MNTNKPVVIKSLVLFLFCCSIISCQTTTKKYPYDKSTSAIGHDITTPERAIIGHWISEDNKTHYYIGPDVLITVNIHELSYKVLSSDIEKNTVHIRAETKTGGHDEILKFSDSRESMVKSIELFGKVVNTQLKYVDGNTSP